MTTHLLTEQWNILNPPLNINASPPDQTAVVTNTTKKIEVDESPYYGLDQRALCLPSFRLIRRDESFMCFSYRCIPLIEYRPDHGIYMNMGRTCIVITGQNLEPLAQWLGQHRVAWIKESKNGYATQADTLFVKNITIFKPEL